MWLLQRVRSAPFAAGLVTATVKTAAADVVTQRYIEGQANVDMRRVGLFTVFGFWYLGAFQYMLYVKLFAKWFPRAQAFGAHPTLSRKLKDSEGLRDLAKQVAAGNFLHIPFCFLPCFYLTQEITTSGTNPSAAHAMARYRANLWDDCVSAWMIWIPGHAIFFSVPMYLRLPVNHAMSFAYVCVLSLMRGGSHASSSTSPPPTPSSTSPGARVGSITVPHDPGRPGRATTGAAASASSA